MAKAKHQLHELANISESCVRYSLISKSVCSSDMHTGLHLPCYNHKILKDDPDLTVTPAYRGSNVGGKS